MLVSFCMMLFAIPNMFAAEQIPLTTQGDDITGGTHGHGKLPIQTPSLWQDGYELTFQTTHVDYAIDIVQDGIVVYYADVDESTTSIVLPSWLSGDFELLLYPENCDYYFYGVISL